MQRALSAVVSSLFIAFAAGCPGGLDSGVDAGDGGTQDGGAIPDAGPVPTGELPFSQWCSTVETGLQNWMLRSQQACGQSGITQSDLPHLAEGAQGIPIDSLQLAQIVSCEPTAHLGGMTAAFANAIQAGRMTYDGKKAAECRELGRASDGGIDAFGGGHYLIEPCGSVLTGNVAVGESCQISEECVRDAYCKPGAANACAGVCAQRLAPGTACSPGRDLCAVDLTCKDDGTGTFVCVENAGEGALCQRVVGPHCKSGLVCSGSGRCVTPAAAGGACADVSECQSGLTCPAGSCAPPVSVGEACGAGLAACGPCLRCQNASEVEAGTQTTCVPAEVGAACRTSADCPLNAFCSDGTCALKPRNGEACFVPPFEDGSLPTEADRGNCLYNDAFCRRAEPASPDGTCAPAAAALGEACSNGPAVDKAGCAQGLFCSDTTSTCVALLAGGEACTAPEQCATGLTCAADLCAPFPTAGQPCTAEGDCDATAYCDESAEVPICAAKIGAGDSCANDLQCQTGVCNRATATCVTPCSQNYDAANCGCPGEGAKGYSMYLLFALVLLAMGSRATGVRPSPPPRSRSRRWAPSLSAWVRAGRRRR